ncbi:MAG TPA: outer membrane beta-barrel protein [Terriglobales bacterium]|nr:outer membrane beta-barrel protein [Terriglobales bacterium]
MRNVISGLAAIFLISTSTFAQIPTKGNIFFGYSYARVNFSGPPSLPDTGGLAFSNPANVNGWNGSLEGKVLPFVGIVADLSGHYGSPTVTVECGFVAGCTPTTEKATTRLYNVLFGPRLSVSVGKFTPFAHVLVGVGHVSETASAPAFSHSSTSFADALGGGIDYKLIKGIAWRGQLDFLQDRFFSNTQNNFRFSTGVVFRF